MHLQTRRLGPVAVALLVGVVAAVGLPHREVVVGHDGGGVLGIEEGGLGVDVAAGLAALGVGAVHGLLARNVGGALHGAPVDDEADGEADEAAEAHAGPVDDLVAGGHLGALFEEHCEAAPDEDVDEELNTVQVLQLAW